MLLKILYLLTGQALGTSRPADQVSKALAVAAAPRGSRGGLAWAGLVRNTGQFRDRTGYPVLITVAGADPQAGYGAVPGRGGLGRGG